MTRRAPQHRGSASVLALVLVGVLVGASLLVIALGGAIVNQRRVEAASDLAALAGAAALQQGGDACEAAADLVRRNGSRLGGCVVVGSEVRVRATRSTHRVLGHRLVLSASARAGPATQATGPPGQRAGGGVSNGPP